MGNLPTLNRIRRLMEKKFGLSATEYELMEFFWDNPGEKSFKEILEYFNNVKGKNWKKQTLSTFLTILQNRGYLKADMSRKKYLYSPTRQREEHVTSWLRKLCSDFFGDSLGRFLTAFSGGQQLSDKDAQELREYLDQYDKNNEP